MKIYTDSKAEKLSQDFFAMVDKRQGEEFLARLKSRFVQGGFFRLCYGDVLEVATTVTENNKARKALSLA